MSDLSVKRRSSAVLVWAGVALLGLAAGPHMLTLGLALGLEALFGAFFLRHLAFAISAMRSAPLDLSIPAFVDPDFAPAVSVLVACKDEESVVPGLVESLLALDYPADRLQLILVNDGSVDRTGDLLEHLASRHPHMYCVHRASSHGAGKSAALNAGLPLATGDVLVVFDADHQPRPDVLRRLVGHFRDPRVGAVQGRCEIRNRDDSPLARLVAIDYFAGYLVNQYGRQSLFRLPAFGGANCAVRASSLRALGGWNEHSVTEDTDLTMRLLLRGEQTRYDVNAVDREEGVVTIRRFWRQRYRWARGHQQVWRDYRRLVWQSRRLAFRDKVETTMFLLVFHLPVASALGLLTFLLWALGLADTVGPLPLALFWTLLFLGSLLELGAGLLIAEADRRDALAMIFFLPLFFVSIALCTKAFVDGLLGHNYQWVKTARAQDGVPEMVSA